MIELQRWQCEQIEQANAWWDLKSRGGLMALTAIEASAVLGDAACQRRVDEDKKRRRADILRAIYVDV